MAREPPARVRRGLCASHKRRRCCTGAFYTDVVFVAWGVRAGVSRRKHTPWARVRAAFGDALVCVALPMTVVYTVA